jgi:prepilin-type N-terminal cleavage/methylation domain-containing protein
MAYKALIRRKVPSSKALTLVELLVVITIIVIIAAITFSVIRGAKAKAKTTTCISNLQQLWKASALYAADFDTMLPHYNIRPYDNSIIKWPAQAEKWKAVMMPYVRADDIFYCPADRGARTRESFGDVERLNSLITSYEQELLQGQKTAHGWVLSIDDDKYPEVSYLQDRISMVRTADGGHTFVSYHDLRMNGLFLNGSVKNITVTD